MTSTPASCKLPHEGRVTSPVSATSNYLSIVLETVSPIPLGSQFVHAEEIPVEENHTRQAREDTALVRTPDIIFHRKWPSGGYAEQDVLSNLLYVVCLGLGLT